MPDTQPLVDQQGQAHDVPIADIAGALDRGWHAPTTADSSRLTTEAAHEQDFGGLAGGAKAALYGGARGASLGLSDVLFRAGGASAEHLRGLSEQFPRLTLGAETLGALAPALAAPESIFARNPAGAVAGIGRTIVESAEGAGTLGKIATATAGGATEGALFGGGQYLSQVALEDKPLAAEGFLGAMGKGALWAAPIGGALAIGEATLHRARALFPRSQVTKAAAREVDQAATSEISNTVRDGDLMLEAAQRKIAQTRAQAGSAQSAENASRAMFGAADPATIQNQVTHSVDHAKLTEAADKYTQAKAHFEDWVRTEADPDLEAALANVAHVKIDLQPGAPRLRAAEFGEVVPPQGDVSGMGEFGLERAGVGKQSALGTPGPHEPPRVPATTELPPLPIADKTAVYNISESGLGFDPKTRTYHDANQPAAHAVADAARYAPAEDVTTVASRPAGLAAGTPAQAAPDDELLSMLRKLRGEVSPAPTVDAGLAELLQATKGKIDAGEPIGKIGAASPGRADYVATKAAKTEQAAMDARAAAVAKRDGYAGSDMAREESALQDQAKEAHGAALSPTERDAIDALKARIAKGEVTGEVGPFTPRGLDMAAERELGRRSVAKTIVDRSLGKEMRSVAKEDAVAAALRRRNGKDVDIGPNLARGARAIDNLESASADLVEQLGADAPKTAVERATAYRSAVQAQAERSGASAAKAAEDIRTKVSPADQLTLVEPTSLPKGPFEQQEFARLREAIHGGKIKGEVGPFNAPGEAMAAEREMARRAGVKTVVDKDLKSAMSGAREEAKQVAFEARTEKGIESALRKAHAADAKHGPGGQSVARAVAGAIDDIAGKIPSIAEASAGGEAGGAGNEHKKEGGRSGTDTTVVDSDIVTALRKHDSKVGAGVPRPTAAAASPTTITQSATGATGSHGLLGTAADIATALEVLHTMGVHTPDVSAIPVIGPVLALFLKARAVLGILGRKGGSIGRSIEGVVAAKSAAVRDRINEATQSLLTVGATAARKAAPIVGPAGALAYKLFPGDGETKSKDPRVLYDARMNEIARALQPGAVEHAVADRIRTSDPDLQDAIAAQTRKGIDFLASKAPRETMLATMLPSDGKWHPSKAAIEQWARYVAAVHDPAGVLEDLAHGHVTAEGAETLRVVYPQLYAEAQRTLLEHAAEFQRTLKYSRRVSISIMFRVPVDGTMTPQHMHYLQGGAGGAAPAPQQGPMPSGGGAPALTGPLQLGQQTMTPFDRRAGV